MSEQQSTPPADELKPDDHVEYRSAAPPSVPAEVTRYHCHHDGCPRPHPSGDHVDWSVYEALRAQVARLEGEAQRIHQRASDNAMHCNKAEQEVTGLLIIEGELRRKNARLAAELAAMTKERDKYRWRESQALECVADYLDALDNDTEPASTSAMRLLFEPRELSGRDTAQAELAAMKADMEAAAGELRVSVSECGPGTLAGKLLSANVLLRHANSDLLSRAVDAEQVRDKIKGGAVTEEQVNLAEEVRTQNLTDQINTMGEVQLDRLDHKFAMRAALQAAAGMRGGG